jgi:hypothetical protein
MRGPIIASQKDLEYGYFTYFEFIFFTAVIIAAAALSCVYCYISNRTVFVALAIYLVLYLIVLECLNNRVCLYKNGIYMRSPLKLRMCRYVPYNDIASIQLVDSLSHRAFSYKIKYISNHQEKTIRVIAPSSAKSIIRVEKVLAEHNIVVEYRCGFSHP